MKNFNSIKGKIKYEQYFSSDVDWLRISCDSKTKFSDDFYNTFKDKLIWKNVCEFHHLSEQTIERFKDYVDWGMVSGRQHLSLEFVEKHQYEINWKTISICQNLNEQWLDKFKDKLNWVAVSTFQHLSEEVFEKYKNYIAWPTFSLCKIPLMPINFIKKYESYIVWNNIKKFFKFSEIPAFKNLSKQDEQHFKQLMSNKNEKYQRS